MNILFVTASLGIGGAQSFLLRMISALPQEHNIFLYDVHPKQREDEILTNLAREIKIFSSKYERLEIKLQKYPKIFTKILNRLNHFFNLKTKIDKKYFNRIIRQKNIQIINSHMYLADSFVQNNCNENIPKVSSFHGCYNLIWAKNRYDELFEELKQDIQKSLNNFSGFIVAADRHKEVFENYIIENQNNIQKIYHGFSEKEISEFDLKQKYNLPESSFIFGMMARGEITKGWQEAIDAFENLQTEKENIYLILSGGTDYMENLKEEYAHNKNIIFTGNISNPLVYINNYDVGLLPSYFAAESLPNTIIEYLYCGKPVIATNWAEIPKMIDFDGQRAGEIVPIKSGKADTNALFSAMKLYIENPNKIKKHSDLAKKAFKKFEMKKCVNSYLDFFEKTINNAF